MLRRKQRLYCRAERYEQLGFRPQMCSEECDWGTATAPNVPSRACIRMAESLCYDGVQPVQDGGFDAPNFCPLIHGGSICNVDDLDLTPLDELLLAGNPVRCCCCC